MIGASKISHGIYLFMHRILCGPLGKEMFKLRCIIRQHPVSYALITAHYHFALTRNPSPSYSGLDSVHFYTKFVPPDSLQF